MASPIPKGPVRREVATRAGMSTANIFAAVHAPAGMSPSRASRAVTRTGMVSPMWFRRAKEMARRRAVDTNGCSPANWA